MKYGIKQIEEERNKQINKKGYTIERDVDINSNGELIEAAKSLLLEPLEMRLVNRPYNWNQENWIKICLKPIQDRVRISAALLVAELDREHSTPKSEK